VRPRSRLPGQNSLRITMTETLQLLFLAIICGFLWSLSSRQRVLDKVLARLDGLAEIQSQIASLAASGSELDLRRLEHVLIDIREGHKRLEERLLQIAETSHHSASGETPEPAAGDPRRSAGSGLSERVMNRLLAMGYERIQILTTIEEIDALSAPSREGELLVEARRAGAVCKGRVAIRAGSIVAVELKSAHAMFP
jgi:hypothetical protein